MRAGLFLAAALCEIGGCYLAWQAWRLNAPWLWLPALMVLGLFAWLLALTGSDSAGRLFAAYGGIYIVASLLFMVTVERILPDRWDLAGGILCLLGAAVIFFAPRGV